MNDMSKIPYVAPLANLLLIEGRINLLAQLSVPGHIDAEFDDLINYEEGWWE